MALFSYAIKIICSEVLSEFQSEIQSEGTQCIERKKYADSEHLCII